MKSIILILTFLITSLCLQAQEISDLNGEHLELRFKEHYKNDQYQLIIQEFNKINEDGLLIKLSDQEQLSIRYMKFHSDNVCQTDNQLNKNNFVELISLLNSINLKEKIKSDYLFVLRNNLNDLHKMQPGFCIALIDIILNNVDFKTLPDSKEIICDFSYIKYYCLVRLEKIQDSELVYAILNRTCYEFANNKFELMLDRVKYHMNISQNKLAHEQLMEIDSLLIIGELVFTEKDSIRYFKRWGSFLHSVNNFKEAKLHFEIARDIAIDSKDTTQVCFLNYELAILEPDPKVKLNLLTELLNDSFCVQSNRLLVLSLLNATSLVYNQLGMTSESYKTCLNMYNLEKKYFSIVSFSTLFNLASRAINIGLIEEAYEYIKLAFNQKNETTIPNLFVLSNTERSSYWINNSWFNDYLNSFASKASIDVPSSTELSYNGNLVSKSLLLETSRELDQALAASSDTTLKENYQNIKSLRKNYSKLLSEGSDNKELMERLNREADSLDKILVNSLGAYAASKRKFAITWKDVQSNLNPTEAAIEFTKYYDDKDSVYKYMALVVRPDYEYPKLELLGEEEQISEYIENRAFEALYPMVWEPIEKHLSGVERVYYSPAGQLNNLSFSALCMGERTELSRTDSSKTRNIIILGSNSDYECSYLMDRYELHQLTTTRYIADGTLEKETSMNASITLSGGINYDIVPKAHSVNKEQDNTEYLFDLNLQKEKERENTKRSSKNTSKMSYLEGTKKELDQVAALFQNKNWSLSAYTDTKAEEGKFKEEVEKNKAGIIHIATHGFAFPDVKKNKRQQLMGIEEISYRASEDPMVRCGLMFSGSNVSWTGNPQKMIEETGEDGILTAAEVSNMDLSNTKLIVLSACETGLGKIEGSEGTFGLKRGFKLAGVEQMIVSLWSVPDKETMELMTLFYEDLTQSLNPVISFEKAQKQMRETYPTRPDLWAGFVLVR